MCTLGNNIKTNTTMQANHKYRDYVKFSYLEIMQRYIPQHLV